MKAILEFDLTDPYDSVYHYRCIKSADLVLMIQEFQKRFYKILDESEDGQTINGNFAIDTLNILIEEYSINLDDLIL